MKKLVILLMIFNIVSPIFAENYLLNGGQDSRINYTMEQKVTPVPGVQTLKLSYVIPESFDSPTYKQKIENFSIRFNPRPAQQTQTTDSKGNRVTLAEFSPPQTVVTTNISFTAINRVDLVLLDTSAPFPVDRTTSQYQSYLAATEQVQANHPKIKAKASQLTGDARTQFDAVQRILTFVVDNIRYVLTPNRYDAMWTLESGIGNCQNFSHLAAALMRACDIPVRIVNGISLKKPYDITTGNELITIKMAQGRHSWIEVYFPDLGWVPFDPQQTQLYVSNRFIRVEIGVDNSDTDTDGLVRWTQSKGTHGTPSLSEMINSDFVADRVNLEAQKVNYGPRNMLLTPRVNATFQKQVVVKVPEPEPKKIPAPELKKLTYTKPYYFGNLDFPRKVNFIEAGKTATQSGADSYEIRKSFLVETAEYVTSEAQYAQTFILDRPLKLEVISLALYRFGGAGQIWVEVYQDNDGRPGDHLGTSQFLDVSSIPYSGGYDWVNFDLRNNVPILQPGRYWIAFGFTGSPIINWFYSYGKPVGPQDGTRYKLIFDKSWSRSLNFEFNFRVAGLTNEN